MRLLGQSEGDPAGSRQSQFRIALLSLLPCLIASLFLTMQFKQKAPAGKQVSFNICPPDLLVLLKYLHVAGNSPHAS